MQEFVGFDGFEGGFERQALVDAEPLAGMAMPLDIERVTADPVDANEGCIELLTEVLRKARAVALQEAIFVAVPFSLDVDGIIERGLHDDREEARFQDGVDKGLACRGNSSLFIG